MTTGNHGVVASWDVLLSLAKLVSIVDDEQDITQLFQDALSRNIDGISVMSFNDPAIQNKYYVHYSYV